MLQPEGETVIVPDSAFFPAESSLSFAPGYGENAFPAQGEWPVDPFPDAASAETLFGSSTQPVFRLESRPPQVIREDISVNILMLDGMAVLLFLLFSLQLFRHRASVGLLFRSLVVKGQFDQLIEEQSVSFRLFIRGMRIAGFLALLALLFRGVLIGDGSSAMDFPEKMMPFLLPLLVSALLCVLFYKRIFMWLISVLSRRNDRADSIRVFNRIWFVTATVLSTPVILLCVLADPVSQKFVFVICFIVLVFLLLYYLAKSFSFFVSRKISILQWILYLCAVEIWPVSFFVLFGLRGFEW